jgi:hypothetical protein
MCVEPTPAFNATVGHTSCSVSPMTEGKVLAIAVVCYGVVLLAMAWHTLL